MSQSQKAAKPVLYHFWSDTNSQRLRLALAYKKIEYVDEPLSYWDDETFFELGLSRTVPILKMPDDSLKTDVNQILWSIDEIFPAGKNLVENIIDEAAWQSLLVWRDKINAILTRMLAPALLNYVDISASEESVIAYKREVQKKYQMSAEALANDRYAAYDQLAQMTNMKALGQHLSKNTYYMGELSIADVLITADLYPLQCLDGVSLPIELLYYLARVEKTCGLDLQQGFKTKLH